MGPVLRKNILFYVLYICPLLAMLTIYWSTHKSQLDSSFIILQTYWMFLLVLGSMGNSEGFESKNGAYKFLSVLPVTPREIVRAKFLLVLGGLLFVVSYNMVLFSFFTHNVRYLFALGSFQVLLGMVCLIVAGLMYAGIFRFGFTRMNFVIWGFVILVFGVSVGTDIMWKRVNDNVNDWVNAADSYWWYLVLIPGLAAFYGLMRLAERNLRRYAWGG